MRIVDLIFSPPDTTFTPPVFIKLELGKRRAIHSAEGALDALDAKGWSPDELKRVAARTASIRALLGLRKTAMAGNAFQEAACESEVLSRAEEP